MLALEHFRTSSTLGCEPTINHERIAWKFCLIEQYRSHIRASHDSILNARGRAAQSDMIFTTCRSAVIAHDTLESCMRTVPFGRPVYSFISSGT